jgi:REP element-mobilizing transposase RayT
VILVARPLRADAAGAVHHVMMRGVERRTIFAGDADREDFLAQLALLVRELGFVVLAWCLLPNHVHLVFKTGSAPLAALMARLASRHARRFNRHEQRVGHLFQDRYKAIRIDDEGGLAACSAYVLGNAVRHGLLPMSALPAYRWSGYAALAGHLPARSFESLEITFDALGMGRERLAHFVAESALAVGRKFAAAEPDQVAELDRLIIESCRRHGADPRLLRTSGEDHRHLKGEICQRAHATLDLPLTVIARRTGVSYEVARRLTGARRRPIGV